MKKLGLCLAVLCATPSAAFSGMTIENCIIREPAPGATVTAAYADVTWIIDEEVKALRLPGPEAIHMAFMPGLSDTVEVHEIKMIDNTAKMQQVTNWNLKEGLQQMRPGAHHVMIKDLKKRPVAGEVYPIEFWFSYSPSLTCQATVMTSDEIKALYEQK